MTVFPSGASRKKKEKKGKERWKKEKDKDKTEIKRSWNEILKSYIVKNDESDAL